MNDELKAALEWVDLKAEQAYWASNARHADVIKQHIAAQDKLIAELKEIQRLAMEEKGIVE